MPGGPGFVDMGIRHNGTTVYMLEDSGTWSSYTNNAFDQIQNIRVGLEDMDGCGGCYDYGDYALFDNFNIDEYIP